MGGLTGSLDGGFKRELERKRLKGKGEKGSEERETRNGTRKKSGNAAQNHGLPTRVFITASRPAGVPGDLRARVHNNFPERLEKRPGPLLAAWHRRIFPAA